MSAVSPLRTIRAESHEATVTVLRELLARAEAGEVIGLVGSVECASHYESVSTVPGKAQSVGMLEMTKLWILERE